MGFKAGMWLTVVVEIKLDGKEDPIPYARAPTVGPFSDWNLLNAVGKLISNPKCNHVKVSESVSNGKAREHGSQSHNKPNLSSTTGVTTRFLQD